MGLTLVLKVVSTIIYGSLLLRLAGRKSIAQMTIAQTVVMLAIGTVLIEPLVGPELLNTFFVIAVTVGTLIAIEYSEIRCTFLKKIFTGEPVLLIENGRIKLKNLKRVRMTVQQLEMELRKSSIASPSEVRYATIEPNGQFGFILKEEFQAMTKQEYREIAKRLDAIEEALGVRKAVPCPPLNKAEHDVFEKVVQQEINSR